MKIPAKPAVFLVSLLWGSEWLFKLSGDTSLSSLPPFRVLALRHFIAAIALVPWVLRGRRSRTVSSGLIPLLPNVLAGVVLIVLPAVYLSLRADLSPGLVVLLYASIPLVASMLETPGAMAASPALLGGLAGTTFLVRGSLSSSPSQTLSLIGMILIVVAIATVLVWARKWMLSDGVNASLSASVMVQMLTAGILFAAYSLGFEHAPAIVWSGTQISVLVALGVLGSAAAYCLFYGALYELRASQLSVVQWLIPTVGIFEITLIFRHLPEWGSLVGGLLVMVSAIALLYAARRGDRPLTLQITDAPEDENARL